ncbi:MAG: flagellar basal body protein, partial [Deltaproteobacteria bacterium]|nr:flagellar basal body protein [Deltaproteobacteria bacterium]
MGSGIYAATAGAVAQSNALDVTAENISNANTTAFKSQRLAFRQAMAAAQSPD